MALHLEALPVSLSSALILKVNTYNYMLLQYCAEILANKLIKTWLISSTTTDKSKYLFYTLSRVRCLRDKKGLVENI
jgi:hypothetical protein